MKVCIIQPAYSINRECGGVAFPNMGIDVILTNKYHRISQVVAKRSKYVTC